MGNPWLLERIGLYLETGALTPEPTLEERIAVAREHARLQIVQMGEDIGSKELRGLLGHYFKGIPGAPHIRRALAAVRTLAEVEALLDEVPMWRAAALRDGATAAEAPSEEREPVAA
jgi:tRNA-dihydrouridine synthase B